REEVLFGERLGRGHERALATGLDGAEQRVERDHGLAGADVALEQALHRERAREVVLEIDDRLLLVRRERERERVPITGDERAGRRERLGDRALPQRRRGGERELEDEQFVEREPETAGLRLTQGARPMHGSERVRAERERRARAQRGGEWLADVSHAAEDLASKLAKPLLCEILPRPVDRRKSCRLHLPVGVVGR